MDDSFVNDSGQNLDIAVKEPPRVKIHHIYDVEGPPFLTLTHQKLQLEYPDGTKSDPFVHDVVSREQMDAVIIVAFDLTDVAQNAGEPKVWLRSCVRPAVASRHPYPNSLGNGWELPAGLIDQGELPEQTAVRELREEIGFSVNEVTELGRPVWGSVGIAPERLFFFCTNVTGLEREKPSEDGSALERHGDCVLVSLSDGLQVGDMKTDLGIFRLKHMFEPLDKVRLVHQVLGSIDNAGSKAIKLAEETGIISPAENIKK